MASKTSIKITNEGIEFLKKLRTNRRKVGTDEEDLSYWKLIELIGKYFKMDNECYVRLVNLGEGKNVSNV